MSPINSAYSNNIELFRKQQKFKAYLALRMD